MENKKDENSAPPNSDVGDPNSRILCDLCRKIFEVLAPLSYSRSTADSHYNPSGSNILTEEHPHTYESLERAAEQGCYVCNLVRETVPLDIIQNPKNINMEYPFESRVKAVASGCITVEIYPRALDIPNLTVRLSLWPVDAGWPDTKVSCVPVAVSSTSSDASWACINQWISECTTRHNSCAQQNSQKSTQWYPTRLLELPKENDSKLVKLIDTKAKPPTGPYITLSHCWGKANMLKLTKATLEEFMVQVPALPRTFEDAVIVAQKLSVRYLWIDSLCIIQEDKEDWQTECSLMNRVYQESFCNIAATASADSHGGLFFNTPSWAPVEILIPQFQFMDDHPGSYDKIPIDCPRDKFLLIDDHLFQRAVVNGPLLKRGWVLQERLLAPRVLHFSKKWLFWECNELCACEIYPDGLPPAIIQERTRRMKNGNKLVEDDSPKRTRTRRSITPLSDLLVIDEGSIVWRNIVETYTRTSLTVRSDKLPALSGIAKYFQPIFGDRYLTGIWRNYIHTELGWYCSMRDQVISRPEQYRAPTWSWASTDNAVLWDEYGNHYLELQVQDVQTTPATDDPTGHVSGGFLIVKGQLNPMNIFSDGVIHMNGTKLEASEVWFDVPQDELRSPDSPFIEGFALPLVRYRKTELVAEAWKMRNQSVDYLQFLFLKLSGSNPENYVRVGLGRSRMYPSRVEKFHCKPEGKFWKDLTQEQIHTIKIL